DILEGDGDLKEKAGVAIQAARFYARWLPQLAVGEGQKPGSFDEFGELAPHVRFVERSSRKLARSTFYAMGRWQAKLEQRQAFLGRIVDIGAELFAIASACVYAQTLGTAEARKLADGFAKQARRRVDALFTDLWSNDDDDNHALALRVLDGAHRWIE